MGIGAIIYVVAVFIFITAAAIRTLKEKGLDTSKTKVEDKGA